MLREPWQQALPEAMLGPEPREVLEQVLELQQPVEVLGREQEEPVPRQLEPLRHR